jgi:hypothetical protein
MLEKIPRSLFTFPRSLQTKNYLNCIKQPITIDSSSFLSCFYFKKHNHGHFFDLELTILLLPDICTNQKHANYGL